MRAVAKLPTGDHRKRMAVVVVRHADRRDYGKLPSTQQTLNATAGQNGSGVETIGK